jgi:hypothetical protein
MKHLFILATIFILSCSTTPEIKYLSFGEKIDEKGAIDLTQLNQLFESSDSSEVKFTADIDAVCQMKGCWMTVKNEFGDDIRVTFKDYGFFVPKDAAGKSTIINGIAKRKVLSQDEAEHYAEDEGVAFDSTRTYIEISIVANGVLIAENTTTQE